MVTPRSCRCPPYPAPPAISAVRLTSVQGGQQRRELPPVPLPFTSYSLKTFAMNSRSSFARFCHPVLSPLFMRRAAAARARRSEVLTRRPPWFSSWFVTIAIAAFEAHAYPRPGNAGRVASRLERARRRRRERRHSRERGARAVRGGVGLRLHSVAKWVAAICEAAALLRVITHTSLTKKTVVRGWCCQRTAAEVVTHKI